jgi:hypothetical protein
MSAVKTTTKATKSPHSYRVDKAGYPSPVEIKDLPKQGGLWGEVGGRALVVDLFNWRDVLTEQQANDNVTDEVRHLIEEATKVLDAPYVESIYADHRSAAIGVLECFAELVAYALKSKDMREHMTQHLSDTVRNFDEMAADEVAEEKALALNIHGITAAMQKGGQS